MNWIDTFCIVSILGFGVWGLIRGFIREAFSLAGIILGIMLGLSFNGVAGDCLHFLLGLELSIAQAVGFVLVFAFIAIGMTLLGSLVRKLAKLVLLGWLDRVLGFVFGLLKGLLIASVGCMILVVLPFVEMDKQVEESKLGDFVIGWAPATYNTFFGGGDFDLRGMMRKYLSAEETAGTSQTEVVKDPNKSDKKTDKAKPREPRKQGTR